MKVFPKLYSSDWVSEQICRWKSARERCVPRLRPNAIHSIPWHSCYMSTSIFFPHYEALHQTRLLSRNPTLIPILKLDPDPSPETRPQPHLETRSRNPKHDLDYYLETRPQSLFWNPTSTPILKLNPDSVLKPNPDSVLKPDPDPETRHWLLFWNPTWNPVPTSTPTPQPRFWISSLTRIIKPDFSPHF